MQIKATEYNKKKTDFVGKSNMTNLLILTMNLLTMHGLATPHKPRNTSLDFMEA